MSYRIDPDAPWNHSITGPPIVDAVRAIWDFTNDKTQAVTSKLNGVEANLLLERKGRLADHTVLVEDIRQLNVAVTGLQATLASVLASLAALEKTIEHVRTSALESAEMQHVSLKAELVQMRRQQDTQRLAMEHLQQEHHTHTTHLTDLRTAVELLKRSPPPPLPRPTATHSSTPITSPDPPKSELESLSALTFLNPKPLAPTDPHPPDPTCAHHVARVQLGQPFRDFKTLLKHFE
eukprot:NODE_4662_length_757_cov_28.000000_g4502_i0.p1 GENE.NODE_4662_length_757_cov_28.000000_g4502_i0~~NODE_4662_length_757_cov_28.000000_g4502_i0.p1  ORF type:complete len:245 (+),score=63.91 NODE_4662_length_757_cov_28.000000_g4502_i0:29-736(+)